MSNLLIAVVAEDETDCQALRKIIHRVLGEHVGVKKWSSKGCSHLRRKLPARLNSMSRKGCNAFIVVHDLDRNPENGALNNELELRKKLNSLVEKFPAPATHLCIPVEELEAWFWSDPKVIDYIGKGKGKASNSPHLTSRPKEKLIALSVGKNRKPRYSTNMNVELAEMLDLELCSQRCPSFQKLRNFLLSL